MKHNSSYTDIDRVNISCKYTYDRKVHFRDCINQYQGKQNSTIHQKIYDDLEIQFERHHLLHGGKETNKEIRFKDVTKNHVLINCVARCSKSTNRNASFRINHFDDCCL
jgi:ribosomal protein S24E